MGCSLCNSVRIDEKTIYSPSQKVGSDKMVKTIITTYQCGSKLYLTKEGQNNSSEMKIRCKWKRLPK